MAMVKVCGRWNVLTPGWRWVDGGAPVQQVLLAGGRHSAPYGGASVGEHGARSTGRAHVR